MPESIADTLPEDKAVSSHLLLSVEGVTHIPPDKLLTALDFSNFNDPDLKESIMKSQWFSIGNGRTMIEVRNSQALDESNNGRVVATDFDDTIMDTSGWHKEEYTLLSESDELRKRGIDISYDKAKELYELSKITLPQVKEPRYTPRVNLILASTYAKALERGEPEPQAWEKVLTIFNQLKDDVYHKGEEELSSKAIDSEIIDIFAHNHTSSFIYQDFVSDILEGSEPGDARVVLTRGKIEGPLGQIHKVHSSGIMDKGIDLIMYTIDLKADTLELIQSLFKEQVRRGIIIYDDNPKEIKYYVDWVKNHKVGKVEVIGVRHPKAKRKDFKVEVQPVVTTTDKNEKDEETVYNVYFSSEEPERDIS